LRRLFAALGFLASCGRTLQRGLRRGSLVGERGLLAPMVADGFGQLRTCCAMRVSDSRANESCCSSRVTSAFAA
jgi:hypothetical protein